MFQSMPDRAKPSPLPVREAQGQPLVLVVEDEAALVTLLRYSVIGTLYFFLLTFAAMILAVAAVVRM